MSYPASVTDAIRLIPRPAFLDSGLRRNDGGKKLLFNQGFLKLSLHQGFIFISHLRPIKTPENFLLQQP